MKTQTESQSMLRMNCATPNNKLSSSSFQSWWWHFISMVSWRRSRQQSHCKSIWPYTKFFFFFFILALLEFYFRLSLVATAILDPVSQCDVGPPFQSQEERFCQVSPTMVIFHLGRPKVAQYEGSLRQGTYQTEPMFTITAANLSVSKIHNGYVKTVHDMLLRLSWNLVNTQ